MKRTISLVIMTIWFANNLLAQAIDSTKVVNIVENRFWTLAWNGTSILYSVIIGSVLLVILGGGFWLLMKKMAGEFVKDKFAEYAEADVKMVKTFFNERKELFKKRANKPILIVNNTQGTRLTLSKLLTGNGYTKVDFRALTTLGNENKHLKTFIDEKGYQIVIFDMIDKDLTMNIVREPNRDYLATLRQTVRMLCITPDKLDDDDFKYANSNKVMALQLWESRLIQELDSML